jgi:hypothetical protein
MMMSVFWRKWLVSWCWGVGVFGVVLAGGAFEATGEPARLLFDVLNGAAPLELDAPMRFSLGVMGAVTLGWSLTLSAAIEAADQLGDQGGPIWRLVTLSVMVWYVVDSLLSIATGFGLNAVSNTVLAAAFLLPILRSQRLRRPA